nr:MAG TPA: hypothetical protein [Caudoviricetes sp.]
MVINYLSLISSFTRTYKNHKDYCRYKVVKPYIY